MCAKVPWLAAVGDYEAQIFKLKQMYNRSKTIHFSTKSATFGNMLLCAVFYSRIKFRNMNVTFEGNTSTGKDEWLTPPGIIKALGEFDLDPCSPIDRPWDTAKHHFNINDNGLMRNWFGRVWCNPPYGKYTEHFLEKAAMHGNCIALTFARTETKMFFKCVWEKATAILFIKGRLKFYHVTGKQGDSAGAPSVLIAYGEENAEILKNCSIKGRYVRLS